MPPTSSPLRGRRPDRLPHPSRHQRSWTPVQATVPHSAGAHPRRALTEQRRAACRGGLVTRADSGWDTLAIDAIDIATSQAYTRHVSNDVIRHAALERQLGRLLDDADVEVDSLDATIAGKIGRY